MVGGGREDVCVCVCVCKGIMERYINVEGDKEMGEGIMERKDWKEREKEGLKGKKKERFGNNRVTYVRQDPWRVAVEWKVTVCLQRNLDFERSLKKKENNIRTRNNVNSFSITINFFFLSITK